MPGEDTTLAAIDIARLAGVGKAAVSNWRRRYDDFPDPVAGTAASPLYALGDIQGWLSRHGKPFEVSAGERAWQRVQAAVADLRLGQLVGTLGAFLVLYHRDRARWTELAASGAVASRLGAAVAAAAPELPVALPAAFPDSVVDAVRATAELAEEMGPCEAFEFLRARYTEVHARRTPSPQPLVTRFLLGLLDVRDATVFDPACGVGSALLAAWEHGAVRLVGQDVNDGFATIAAASLLLRTDAVTVAHGDSLGADAFPELRAGIVLCRPPLGMRSWNPEELTSDPRWEHGLPPRGEPELAWLQHCLAHAEQGGRVAVLMPPSVAARRSGRRIRGNLLRSGALRGVIRLPAYGSATDLWLLRRPGPGEEPPARLFLSDRTGRDGADPDAEATELRAAWDAFLAGADLPEGATAPRLVDLLDEDVDLNPARHLRPRVDRDAGLRYPRARDEIVALAERLASGVPALAAAPEPGDMATTTLGELVRAGSVAMYQAPIQALERGGDHPMLTAKDVRLGRGATGRTAVDPATVLTEAGDIVTPATPRHLTVRVLVEGGAALGPHLMAFRVVGDTFDAHFLAGLLRAAAVGGALTPSTHSLRIDPRRAPVPLLPIAEQRRYGEAFRGLLAVEDVARDLSEQASEAVVTGLAGLAGGSLLPRRGAGA